jgi:hypothetical protein
VPVLPEGGAHRYNRRRGRIEGPRESPKDHRRTVAAERVAPAASTRATRSACSRPIDLASPKDALMLIACRNSRAAMPSIDDNRLAGVGARLTRMLAVGLVCLVICACAATPTQPRDSTLPAGRWTGDNGCLSVAVDGCDLVVGCGHGQFPPPVVHADGTFEVSGTYRIEVGPVSINPAPPAIFSGVMKGQTLTLSVTPSDRSVPPASYVLHLTNGAGKCVVPCL